MTDPSTPRGERAGVDEVDTAERRSPVGDHGGRRAAGFMIMANLEGLWT
jgi:hypothetical protein